MTIRNVQQAGAKLFFENRFPTYLCRYTEYIIACILAEAGTVDHHSEFDKAPLNRADSVRTCTLFGPGSLIICQLQLKFAIE